MSTPDDDAPRIGPGRDPGRTPGRDAGRDTRPGGGSAGGATPGGERTGGGETGGGETGIAPGAGPVRRERLLLAAALAEAGPESATRCAGWDARDLAAHLVVRESRPDAAPGIALAPLARYTERVRRRAARHVPFDRLVERFVQGPPKYSPFALPGVDEMANALEFFVHHEDVRRARPGAEPREISPELQDLLWRRIRIARFVLRKIPVEVTLVQPDGRALRVAGRGRGAHGAVRVHGPVGELVLWATGRRDVADVRLTGDTGAVKTLTETGWSL